MELTPPVFTPSVRVVDKGPRKLILRNSQSPGDLAVMAYAIKALHEQHPGKYLTDVRSPCSEIFEGNPYITPISDHDPTVTTFDMEYPWIHKSNQAAVHFVNSFIDDLSNKLNIKLEPIEWQGAIYIRDEEKGWYSAIYEILGKDVPFWCINAGYKLDYTLKQYEFARWQEIIDRNQDVIFVQVGMKHPHHVHPELKGKNLINLLGKTDLRQLIRLVYNSFGVISYTSLLMVLGYAVPPHPRFGRKSRGIITIGGSREGSSWQMANNHQFLHTCGMLDCCDMGGCWKSRIVKLNDKDLKDDELCVYPVLTPSGQWVAKCMDMISTDEVCMHLRRYVDNLDYQPKY